jgi:hypothetical protein
MIAFSADQIDRSHNLHFCEVSLISSKGKGSSIVVAVMIWKQMAIIEDDE